MTQTANVQGDIFGMGSVAKIVKWVLIALAVTLIIFFGYKLYKRFKQKQLEKVLDEEKTTTIGGTTVSIAVGTVAGAINDAFHNYYGGMAEDEDRAIAELLNVPKQLIPAVSDAYFKISGNSLKGDFLKYLDDDEYAKVRHLLG